MVRKTLFLALFILSMSFQTAIADSCPLITRNSIIRYAASAVGSPYVWGGDKWDPNNRSWAGADCSGLILKAWQIPRKADYTQSVGHPYNTYSFFNKNTHWNKINRSDLAKGDILVYRSKGGGHAVIYHHGDPWGSPVVYEARSKTYGIVYNQRYFPSSFQARRRHRLIDSSAGVMATVKISSTKFLPALPNTYASRNLYFDYFGKKDDLHIRNSDHNISTTTDVILQNRRYLNRRQISIGAYLQDLVAVNWRANGYLRMATTGQKAYAWRQGKGGHKYLAKTRAQAASTNFVPYFEPRRDILYLTNPNKRTVRATIYLANNNKLYNKKVIRIKGRSVAQVSYKRSKLRRLRSVYVRVNSRGGRIFVSKKTASSFFASAQTAGKLSKESIISNFSPSRNLLYITNPNRKPVRVILKYIKDGRSYFAKRLKIGPKDVILVDNRRRLKNREEAYLQIKSNRAIMASKRMANATYQLAQPRSFASKTLYAADFSAANETLYVLNPAGSSSSVSVNIIANGAVIFSGTYDVPANTQLPIDLRGSTAAAYSNTYLKIQVNN